MTVDARPMVTVHDLAVRFAVGEKTIRRWIHEGRTPRPFQAGNGGGFRFDPDEIDEWVASRASGEKAT
jgi:excisionase family DNA binding protein